MNNIYIRLLAGIILALFLIIGLVLGFLLLVGGILNIMSFDGLLMQAVSVACFAFFSGASKSKRLLQYLIIGYALGLFIGLTLITCGILHGVVPIPAAHAPI